MTDKASLRDTLEDIALCGMRAGAYTGVLDIYAKQKGITFQHPGVGELIQERQDMPPLTKSLDPDELSKVVSDIKPGDYSLAVTEDWQPHLVPEGGMYFTAANKTFVIWPKRI